MKKLLIHHNNTSFNTKELFALKEQFVFDIDSDKDADFYMDDILSGEDLKKKLKQSDVLFIKVSLSQNYMEYLGIRLAYHVRLTKALGAAADIPIVFIAEETIQFLGLTSIEPQILFTGGIYVIRESLEDYNRVSDWFEQGIIRPLQERQAFIDKVIIHPPANYLSHHAIANEWSILRWAKVLGLSLDGILLRNVKRNIEGLLYYKFLSAKYPVDKDPETANLTVKGIGKVLYIDDEWNKGWAEIFRHLFAVAGALDERLRIFEHDFRDTPDERIMADCEAEIKAAKPDVVILDLRLSNSDFESNKIVENFTGYKLLKHIKGINPGIRVIIFTASNKVWNLIELQNAGADGFVLKESPEMAVNYGGTKNTVEKFVATMEDQMQYRFQKRIFDGCNKISRYLRAQEVDENPEYNDFLKDLNGQLEIFRSAVMLINLNRPATIDIAFLSAYTFLEFFKSHYEYQGNNDFRFYLGYDRKVMKRYSVNWNTGRVRENGEFMLEPGERKSSWFNTMAALFADYFSVSKDPHPHLVSLSDISRWRNGYIHEGRGSFSPAELELIMEMMSLACKQIKE